MHTWTQITVERAAPIQLSDPQDEKSRWESLDPRGKKDDTIAINKPYLIKVNLQGQLPRKPEAKVEIISLTKREMVVKLDINKDKQSASFTTGITDMTHQNQTEFKFRILANDARSRRVREPGTSSR